MGGPLGSYRVVDVIGIPNWWKHMGIGPEHEPFKRCLDHHGRKKEDLAYHRAQRPQEPVGQIGKGTTKAAMKEVLGIAVNIRPLSLTASL
jgi:hypothetical protein